MNAEHHPIDHKDDSAEYRAQVWEAVQQRVGSPLTPLEENTSFDGFWDVCAETFGARQPIFRLEFGEADAVLVVVIQGNDQTPQSETYAVKREGQLTLSGATYHAASSDADELVLFNGDSSLVLIGTKRD